MSGLLRCHLGPVEHDGSRFCHAHVGRVSAGSPTPWQCDAIAGCREATPDEIAEWLKTGRVNGGRCRLVAGVGLVVPA